MSEWMHNKQRHDGHRNGWIGGDTASNTDSEPVIVKFEIVILSNSYVTLGQYLTFFSSFLLVFFFFFFFLNFGY